MWLLFTHHSIIFLYFVWNTLLQNIFILYFWQLFIERAYYQNMSRTSRNRRRRQKRKLSREKFRRQMSDLVVRLASFAIETAGKEAGPFLRKRKKILLVEPWNVPRNDRLTSLKISIVIRLALFARETVKKAGPFLRKRKKILQVEPWKAPRDDR